jgi:predicted hydrocarbon binding protein
MHGIILSELKRFVSTKHGDDVWVSLLREAGRSDTTYLANGVYPDEDAVAIVAAASRLTGAPATAILEEFGEYIAPHLLEIYHPLIPEYWRTLDIIEKTEDHVHRVVRIKSPGSDPPRLRAERISPTQVNLHYSSQRKMCSVAIGIGRGLGKHFGERIEITEPSCMHRGDPECLISFRKVA